jgi:hypothetical protein
MASTAFASRSGSSAENVAALGLAYSSAPKTMKALPAGSAGLLFFAGVTWFAGLAALDRFGGLACFASFWVFLVYGLLGHGRSP